MGRLMKSRHFLLAGLASVLVACGNSGGSDVGSDDAQSGDRPPLQQMFDCMREEGGVAIAAHRGGPAPGFPENALETMQYGWARGIRVFEIDVAESQDGVLILMHDRSLTRTTTGSGAVAETDWKDIEARLLRDEDGKTTSFRVPKLSDALKWAVDVGAVLELDRKPTTSFRNIMKEVRAAGAENNVILISYDDKQASEIARIAPEQMLTATARGADDVAKLSALGVNPENLIAWTGTNQPDPAAWKRLRKIDIEPAFGTLGRPGERLDDIYLADGNLIEFQNLVDAGLVLLATDIPYKVERALRADDIAADQCHLKPKEGMGLRMRRE